MCLGRVDDGARDQRTDEGRRLTDDAEQAEEEELVAAGSDFGDHNLRIAVPRADHESVIDLEQLYQRT